MTDQQKTGWNMQDWKMTDWKMTDGVEEEQMYMLHTKKNFNVYDM